MSDAHVWLAKETPPIDPFVIRLNGETAGSALTQGRWVVVDATGTLKRVGRIFRIRTDRDATLIYIDKLQTVRNLGSLADLGLTLPQGTVTRLRPEAMFAVLARDGVPSAQDVPIIQDAAYVRDLLEMATRDDLLGPANGPAELVIDMSVRDRYRVGKVASQSPTDALAETNNERPSPSAHRRWNRRTSIEKHKTHPSNKRVSRCPCLAGKIS